MKKYYVYMLLCADGSYYTGVTNDIDQRLAEHQYGLDHSCYTYAKRPVKLVFVETFGEILQAIAAEKQIKGWSRKKKDALLQGDFDLLLLLAKRHTPFKKNQREPCFETTEMCHPEEARRVYASRRRPAKRGSSSA